MLCLCAMFLSSVCFFFLPNNMINLMFLKYCCLVRLNWVNKVGSGEFFNLIIENNFLLMRCR